jgi:hypothetical protein
MTATISASVGFGAAASTVSVLPNNITKRESEKDRLMCRENETNPVDLQPDSLLIWCISLSFNIGKKNYYFFLIQICVREQLSFRLKQRPKESEPIITNPSLGLFPSDLNTPDFDRV